MTDFALNDYQAEQLGHMLAGAPVIATVGGWGCGKTASQALALWLAARSRPGGQYAWLTDTSTRRERVLMPEAQKFFLGGRYESSRRRWLFPNGSAVWMVEYFRPSTRAAEANPLEGLNLNGGCVDECQMFRDAEPAKKLRGRLRQRVSVEGRTCEPFMLLHGLPVYDAWWARYAEDAGGVVLRPTSHANLENLGEGWLEQVRQELDDDEYAALVEGRPMPLKGLVLDKWRAEEWPDGNILSGWRYRPDVPTVLAVDFGLNRPTGVLIQHDPERDIDVIFAEVMPGPRTVTEFADEVLALAWPRRYARHKPADVPYWLDEAVCDPAGQAGNSQTRLSDVDVLAQPPHRVDGKGGGVGIRPFFDTDPVRREIEGSLLRLQRRIYFHGRRRLVMTRELWEAGLRAPMKQRTLARCILGHARDERGRIPKDDGFKDGVDALRYWARGLYWFDHPLDGRIARAAMEPDKTPMRASGIIRGNRPALGAR